MSISTTRRLSQQQRDDYEEDEDVPSIWQTTTTTTITVAVTNTPPTPTLTTTTVSPLSCTAECPRAIARGCSPGMNGF
ncbi:hypothetical protein BDZ89DRAFT_567093 [Hymenopellis radicata]|nr:hypothetical protein BDZ89DRAFT_567093 [Hymenopellis radicata]